MAGKESAPTDSTAPGEEAGPKKRGRGRPSKLERAAERLAQEKMADYLLSKARPVLDTYIALALGKSEGKKKRKLDPATVRHFIERFIPPATKTIHLMNDRTIEDFYDLLEKELAEKAAAGSLLEDKSEPGQPDEPEKEKLH